MKFLIVGRAGVGKDTLAQELESVYDMKQLKSYTTRPRRTPDENTHVFITPEEAAAFTERAAETVINGYEYFATRQQVLEHDVYIVDPNGLYQLVANMPDTEFMVIYMTAGREEARRRAVERAAEQDKEEGVIAKRLQDEDEQFTLFEKRYMGKEEVIAPNCKLFHIFDNGGDVETLKEFACHLANLKREVKNLKKVVLTLLQDDVLYQDEEGRIKVWTFDREEPLLMSVAQFVTVLLQDKEGLATCLSQYIALHDL